MTGLPISKVVDKTMRRQQPHNAGINFIHNHPVGAAPEGWAFVYKRCLPSLDFSL